MDDDMDYEDERGWDEDGDGLAEPGAEVTCFDE